MHTFRPCKSMPIQMEPRDPSPLVEAILTRLEDAGCPTQMNDKIVEMIEGWEYAASLPHYGEDMHPDGVDLSEPCGCGECLSDL